METITYHRKGATVGCDHSIVYRTVEPHHRDSVLQVLTGAFVNEPSTAACSIGRPSYDQWERFTDFFMDECSTNGLSVVALDANDMETVAGALINRDFLNPLPPGFIDFIRDPSPLAPLIKALDIIDEAWFKMHPEIKGDEQGKVADLWMIGVHPEYRDCGIASNLVLHSLEHVERAGFEYAIVECTGAFSQRLFKKAGCSPVFALPYKDFLWKGEAVFRNVPPPHTKWEIYEKKLQ